MVYFSKDGGKSWVNYNLKKPFPTDEIDFGDALCELLYENKYTGKITTVLSLFNKHASADFALYFKKRRLDEGQAEELDHLNPEAELYERLPWMLAQDINAARFMDNAPLRVVLLFDTHEVFWNEDRDRKSENNV